MAVFQNAPVTWPGTEVVHIVTNSVHVRTAKFTKCGAKIGPNEIYDGVVGKTITDFRPLAVNCTKCLNSTGVKENHKGWRIYDNGPNYHPTTGRFEATFHGVKMGHPTEEGLRRMIDTRD